MILLRQAGMGGLDSPVWERKHKYVLVFGIYMNAYGTGFDEKTPERFIFVPILFAVCVNCCKENRFFLDEMRQTRLKYMLHINLSRLA